MKLYPLVIGPDQIPRSLDLDDARQHPALAALAAMVHGRSAGSKQLTQIALQVAIERMKQDEERSTLLLELITASVGAKIVKEVEEEMDMEIGTCFTTIGRRKFAEGLERGTEKGIEKGRRGAQRQAIALVLESRGLSLTPTQHRRLERCSDDARLEQWLRRAATVERAQHLFARAARA